MRAMPHIRPMMLKLRARISGALFNLELPSNVKVRRRTPSLTETPWPYNALTHEQAVNLRLIKFRM